MGDGPSLGRGRSAGQFEKRPETIFISGGLELITSDGLPIGRGQSARAVTASSDTQLLHYDSLVYKGGLSGF